ncbi:MAG: hypothetical protein IAE77_14610 [Prosthecobacter sp.]|jgi:hypothetical protein|nr:hypothetical protein [Prosthecobacter sp.]
MSLEILNPTNHMKTNTTLSTASNDEITLGWNSMPAYGEVMNTLVGIDHTSITSTLKLEKPSLVKSFWSMLGSAK